MKRDYIEFQERSSPLAYLITIRTYGTWLHGDERGSMDRREYNRFGEAKIAPSKLVQNRNRNLMKAPAFVLKAKARQVVETAVREVCEVRGCAVFGINIRTNHGHIVASAVRSPESLMNSLKSYSTRKLRQEALATSDQKIWSRHGSTRYLWNEKHLESAVDYVVNEQGAELPTFD